LLLQAEERRDEASDGLTLNQLYYDIDKVDVDINIDIDDSTGDYLFDYPSPECFNCLTLTRPPPPLPPHTSAPPPNPHPSPALALYPYQNDHPDSRLSPTASPSYYPYQHNPHDLKDQYPRSSHTHTRYTPLTTTRSYRNLRPTPPRYQHNPDSSDSPYNAIREPFPDPFPTFTATPSPTDPDNREGEDEDLTWLVALVLIIAFTISLVSAIRTCGQKAGWLTGSSTSASSSTSTSSSPHHRRHGGSGRGVRRGFGNALLVPDSEVDPEMTPDRLNTLSDADRQAYDAAEGVSAWEFEPSYDHQLYVHDRTELSFFDRVASIQTNLPLPKQQEVYYWEVKMFEKSPRTTIAIGVATKPYPLTRLPGWNRHSIGYFSHNGQKYCNSLWSGVPFGPTYFEGDVVGCGYRPRNGTIFFTRNGKRIDDAYTGYGRTNLFPTVGATGPCVLHINFGQSGFVFVEANVKKWGLAPAAGSLAPPPAYGSELGSILLEAAGSGTGAGSGSRALPQRFTSSSSSGSLAGAGRPIMQHSSPARTRISTANGNGDGNVNGHSNGRVAESSPVPITLANMSAPPPNYSSLDRYGHPRTDQGTAIEAGGAQLADDDVETASIASNDSDESATLLLGDTIPDRHTEYQDNDL
ncbi:Rsp5p-dependent ubiquitination, sorting of cargo proteins at the multivesicular body, partial [Linnemannia exigua]